MLELKQFNKEFPQEKERSMKENKYESKLTAYILGELNEKEVKEIEAAIKKDPTLEKEIKTIQETTSLLRNKLKEEPCPQLNSERRQKIMENKKETKKNMWSYISNPWSLGAGFSVAVACVFVFIWMSKTDIHQIIRQQNENTTIMDDKIYETNKIVIKKQLVKKKTPEYKMKSEKSLGSPLKEKKSKRYRKRYSRGKVGSLGMMNSRSGILLDSISRPVPSSQREMRSTGVDYNTEAYDHIVENPYMSTLQNPLSTFSIDVDTASYANMRRFINQGQLPPKDAIRIEELINYFSYNYSNPKGKDPFSVNVEVAESPWHDKYRLVRIALKGKSIDWSKRPVSNFVFLLDVSGSMSYQNKLPLLKKSLKLLLETMGENDRIAIVVYAGASGLVLPSTTGSNKSKIIEALEKLSAGGSTNAGQGIQLAYKTALENYIKGGNNRVILATDGDFNVGISNQGDLIRLVKKNAKKDIFLSVLGFGMGNLKDSTLEKLADNGNGNYAYIDTLREAKKVLVTEAGGTFVTIAKDVKIQVEFNPTKVNAYRLIGYENRMLKAQDFNNDKKDAGEIGAGHTVTALYEIVPAGVKIDIPKIDKLKYQQVKKGKEITNSKDLFTLKIRHKKPDGETSVKREYPVYDSGKKLNQTSPSFRFAAAVASFGMILRESKHKGKASFEQALKLAREGQSKDIFGYRSEFIQLIEKAKKLKK